MTGCLGSNRRSQRRVPLHTVLLLPLVSLIVLTAVLVGTFSYLNGQKAVENVAQQLHNAIAIRIKEHLQSFLQTPHQVLETNAQLMRLGMLDPSDPVALQRQFLEQVKTHPTLTSIYFGVPNGGIAGSGREGASGELYIYATENFNADNFNKYRVDENGNIESLLVTIPKFDARSRPWYIHASQERDATWSEVYFLITGQDMAIAASRPVYDRKGSLLGIVSVDIFLSHLSNYLESLEISKSGKGYILERNGYLVAISSGEKLTLDLESARQPTRIYAWESQTPLIKESAQYLLDEFGSFKGISGERQLKFQVNEEWHFLKLLPVSDDYGIDWLIVVVVPESDFMASIWANNRSTWIILTGAIGVALFLGIIITTTIANRISNLNRSTHALAEEAWDLAAVSNSRIREIDELAISFNQMSEKIRQLLESLQSEIAKRSQIESSLRESEDRYRTLVENNPVGMVRSTPEGKILTANPSFLNMFGLDKMKDLETLNATSLYAYVDERELIFKKLLADGALKKSEIQFKKRDGSIFWGSLIARAVFDKEGEILFFDGTVENITAQKIAQDRLKHVATHDLVTNLPNRSLFNDRLDFALKRARRQTYLVAVLFLDLDGFKSANDDFGHKQGDRLLKVIANRLRGCIRASDSIARLGGDEFAILLEKLEKPEDALPVLQKVLKSVAEPVAFKDMNIAVTTSIGVSIYPLDGTEPERLLQRADMAMYRAKKSGKNSYQFFSEP